MGLEEYIIRLLIVVALGFIIGFERQLTGHNCSFKTTILIAVGSFVFACVEVNLGSNDARMAANVITGIGFLCSGVIFKNGATVNGLNTSATLWCTAAISVVLGYGYIWQGVIATAILVALNILMAFVDEHVHPLGHFVEMNSRSYYIYVECLKEEVKDIKRIIQQDLPSKAHLDGLEIENLTTTTCRITIKLSFDGGNRRVYISELVDEIFDKDVMSVSYEKVEE